MNTPRDIYNIRRAAFEARMDQARAYIMAELDAISSPAEWRAMDEARRDENRNGLWGVLMDDENLLHIEGPDLASTLDDCIADHMRGFDAAAEVA